MKSHALNCWAAMLVLALFAGMCVAANREEPAPAPAAPAAAPGFVLEALPYAQDALEPYITARTMGFHYGKHHQGYVDNLNKLAAGAKWAAQPLDQIIRETAGVAGKAAVFNNAAQV